MVKFTTPKYRLNNPVATMERDCKKLNRHEHIGENLNPASVSNILKGLQSNLDLTSTQPPLSGHSFTVGAAIDLSEHGKAKKVMLSGKLQASSTAMASLGNRT